MRSSSPFLALRSSLLRISRTAPIIEEEVEDTLENENAEDHTNNNELALIISFELFQLRLNTLNLGDCLLNPLSK